MKRTIKILSLVAIIVITSCKKESKITSGNPSTKLTANNNQSNGSLSSREDMVELYFRDGIMVPESDFDKTIEPRNEEEYVTIVDDDTLFHHYFTDMNSLTTWANTIADGNKLIAHLNKFDELSSKAQREGEIDYFEANGHLSDGFHNYLLNGDYNYEYTPNNRVKSAALGHFY